jgi:mannose-6-phosphate isomerase-like protein (cupin superfamily)
MHMDMHRSVRKIFRIAEGTARVENGAQPKKEG